MTEAFIGLDLGTTSIKAVAFDEEGNELAAASHATPTNPSSIPADNDGAEYDADELWSTAALLLQQVTGRLRETQHRPVAVATASMGEAGVLLDPVGQPVAPVIAWFDRRTQPQAEWWIENVGAERTQRIAGVQPRPVFSAAKMLWTREHLPDAWAASDRWLHMADWAAFRLSGQMATDLSLASRTMLFNLAGRCWSEELLDAAGLPPSLLAPLVQSGSVVGRVTPAAAEETGLPEGTIVGAGGQDHVCAALALGVIAPGMLLDSIGTAEAFFLVTDEVDQTGRLAAAGISQGAHVEPGRTYAMTGLANGGGRIDARRQELALDWSAFLGTTDADAVIDELAADGEARIAELLAAAQVSTAQHMVTGGGSRNGQLVERKRTLSGRDIQVAEQTEATALGAAMLARRAHQTAID